MTKIINKSTKLPSQLEVIQSIRRPMPRKTVILKSKKDKVNHCNGKICFETPFDLC